MRAFLAILGGLLGAVIGAIVGVVIGGDWEGKSFAYGAVGLLFGFLVGLSIVLARMDARKQRETAQPPPS